MTFRQDRRSYEPLHPQRCKCTGVHQGHGRVSRHDDRLRTPCRRRVSRRTLRRIGISCAYPYMADWRLIAVLHIGRAHTSVSTLLPLTLSPSDASQQQCLLFFPSLASRDIIRLLSSIVLTPSRQYSRLEGGVGTMHARTVVGPRARCQCHVGTHICTHATYAMHPACSLSNDCQSCLCLCPAFATRRHPLDCLPCLPACLPAFFRLTSNCGSTAYRTLEPAG
jgi:hypothetical protein